MPDAIVEDVDLAAFGDLQLVLDVVGKLGETFEDLVRAGIAHYQVCRAVRPRSPGAR